jgi:hypothetical protein
VAKTLTVNGEDFEYPTNREPAGWGEDATGWAEAVTNVLSNVTGTGDILLTDATINNNQSSPANVTSLSFDPANVRGAVVIYTIYRVTTSTGATEATETGTIYVGYKSTAGTWDITVVGSANAGVTFSITAGGQIQYTSTNFSGSSYSGVMTFKAQALPN